MKRAATSKDVAKLAGVSRTAVSLVLNGHGAGNIAPDKQAAIHAAAAELNYRPNAVALSLRHQRTRTIGVVTDSIATSAFGGIMLQGAMQVAREAGYLLLVIDTMNDAEREREAFATLMDRQVDGFLYAAMSQRDYVPAEQLSAASTVLVNCHDPARRFTSVYADEVSGGRAATQVLVDAGHREIQLLAGTTDHEAAQLRIEGHVAALVDAGLTVPEPVVCGWGIDDGYRCALQVLDVPVDARPTGIVCANDRVALGVVLAAARLGITVPEQLSVVGYDDDENVAPRCVPPLTTVALPHRAIGETAVRRLLQLLDHETATSSALPCELVARDSVAAPLSRSDGSSIPPVRRSDRRLSATQAR